MNEYHREVVDFLRGYGATDVGIVPGGRHPHVDFMFRGTKFNLAVHADGDGHTDAAIIKIKELKSLLGEAVVVPNGEARSLNDMLPPAPDLPRYTGGIAMYRTANKYAGLSMRVFPPAEIVQWISKRPMGFDRLAHDTWLLKPSYADGHELRLEGKKWMLTTGSSMTKGFDDPMGVSNAEFMIVEGTVRIRLLLDQVRPISVAMSEAGRRARAKSTVDTHTTASGARWVEPPRTSPADAWAASRNAPAPAPLTDARRILSLIMEFERATPYRLVRVKDTSTWAWQAPLIRLEEPPE